jgi:hypothetical protein
LRCQGKQAQALDLPNLEIAFQLNKRTLATAGTCPHEANPPKADAAPAASSRHHDEKIGAPVAYVLFIRLAIKFLVKLNKQTTRKVADHA